MGDMRAIHARCYTLQKKKLTWKQARADLKKLVAQLGVAWNSVAPNLKKKYGTFKPPSLVEQVEDSALMNMLGHFKKKKKQAKAVQRDYLGRPIKQLRSIDGVVIADRNDAQGPE